MEPGTGIGLLLLGVTVLGTIIGLISIVVASRMGNRPVALSLAVVLAIWLATYTLVLLWISLSSQAVMLGTNQNKYFCGFYLDCHMSVAVTDVQTAKTLGSGAAQVTAQGDFYVVTMRVSNSAKREKIGLLEPKAIVIEDGEREIGLAPEGLRALGVDSDLARQVAAGSSYTTTLVFDLPLNPIEPRLDVTEGWGIDHAIELFLIGDEDSLLHKRTFFRLEPGR